MIERYGGIWLDVSEDDGASLVYERYLEDVCKIHAVYQRRDESFTPYSYIIEKDYQWRLPVWTRENDKSLLPSLKAAIHYLSFYDGKNT